MAVVEGATCSEPEVGVLVCVGVKWESDELRERYIELASASSVAVRETMV